MLTSRFGPGDYILDRRGRVYRREENGELRRVGEIGEVLAAEAAEAMG